MGERLLAGDLARPIPINDNAAHPSLHRINLKPSHDDAPASRESIIRLLCGEPPDRIPHPRSPARFNRT